MKFDPFAILKKINLSHLGYPALIIAFFMVYYGQVRIGISAEKGPERNEFTIKKYFLLLIPAGSEELPHIEKARFLTESEKDGSLKTSVVLLSARFQHVIYTSPSEDYDAKKREMYNDLSFFLSDEKQTEFSESYVFTYASCIFGYILVILSILFIKYGPRNSIAPLVEKAAKLIPEKPKETKEQKKQKTEKRKNGRLRVIISAIGDSVKTDPRAFDIEENGATAIVCASGRKAELENLYGDDCDYIICDNANGTADILPYASQWLNDFAGYVMIQSDPSQKTTRKAVQDLLKAHIASDCDCTIAVAEVADKKIPYGKIVRNVANRITKISESEETRGENDRTSEVYAGIMCFNTKNLKSVIANMNIGQSSRPTDIVRIAEAYHKKGSRVTAFTISSIERTEKEPGQQKGRSNTGRQYRGIVLATQKIMPGAFRKNIESLSSLLDSSFDIITRSEYRDMAESMSGGKAGIIISDKSIGDADDMLQSHEKFRNFIGDMIVVPETWQIISENDLKYIMKIHEENSNVLTVLKDPSGKDLLYCANSFQLYYAVRKVNRNEDSGKYMLSDITEILENDKKRIQTLSVDNIENNQ